MTEHSELLKRLHSAHHAFVEAADSVIKTGGDRDAVARLGHAKGEYDAACESINAAVQEELRATSAEATDFLRFLESLTRRTAHAGQPFPFD